MTVIRPDRLSDVDQAATEVVNEVEGEIREFVRRDLSVFRRGRPDNSNTSNAEAAAENISSLISRVSAASVAEVERVIAELTSVRDMLRSEGDRVQREISGYAALSQAAMASMTVIGESLSQWKPDAPPRRQSNG